MKIIKNGFIVKLLTYKIYRKMTQDRISKFSILSKIRR